MKTGIRKPSVKKSITARTTGKVKRKLKRVANPFYGKKGTGWITNPRRALYNKAYRKTTISTKKASGCLAACLVYPVYYSFALTWWVLKYMLLALWWLGVFTVKAAVWLAVAGINAGIALVEKITNIGAQDPEPPAPIDTPAE